MFLSVPSAIRRYLTVGGAALAGVLAPFAVQALKGNWHWVGVERVQHVVPHVVEFLPVPVAFLLWLRIAERDGELALSFSPFFCALSVAGFAAGQELETGSRLWPFAFATGVIAALFILAPCGECLRRMIRQLRPVVVAAVAATAVCNYYWLSRMLARTTVSWTTAEVYALLTAFGVNAIAYRDTSYPAALVISSHQFSLEVFADCSGWEGVFLFNFLLSVMLLINWQLYRRRSILLLYALGIIYMFGINALRIAAIFTVGYWAYRPDAWEWVHSMRGTPLSQFHTYAGWFVYLAAFQLFDIWLYLSALRERSTVGEAPPG